jgi:hypothetical protein
MKLAFVRTGTRHRRALRNEASFYAKRLILVAQMEKNGINKEIRRQKSILPPVFNVWLTINALQRVLGSRLNAFRVCALARF